MPTRSFLATTRFERKPPQFTEPVGEARRHINSERHAGGFQNRIGVLFDVAITVVEREADKAFAKVAFAHAAMQFVETDKINTGAAQ